MRAVNVSIKRDNDERSRSSADPIILAAVLSFISAREGLTALFPVRFAIFTESRHHSHRRFLAAQVIRHI
jgi:hypothetical protein